ncbi:MAG TPA: (d)CMP kinase [Solirubrobacteraceae bacterium]|jgi:cytidylate kinase|nr:(d)CMP kinase [Solirubrobacteraceae bacterium]
MIVAIDGPVGAGKSTVARGVAAALEFSYLDSGALYRCVALASLEDPAHSPQEHAAALEASLGERVLLCGRDVTREIRSPTVSAEASRVAALPEVRAALLETQRALLASGDWVAEGRDIATVVAPAAEIKVYLTASEDERARRRARELGAGVEEVRRELAARDARDGSREHSPLVADPHAVVLDSGGLDADQVVARIVNLVKEALGS